jgi:methyl-accepting chemotaxis protein
MTQPTDSAIPPSKIDPAQFAEVIAFKNDLSRRGGLYWEFDATLDFEAALRVHLSTLVQKFTQSDLHSSAMRFVADEGLNNASLNEDQSDELGYLDYVDIFASKIDESTGFLESIARQTERFSEQIVKRTEQIKASADNQSRARIFMRRFAEDINGYASSLDGLISVYSECRVAAFDALGQAVLLHYEIRGKDESLADLRGKISDMVAVIDGARNGVGDMQKAVIDLPRMIKEINVSKRFLVNTLERFLVEIDATKLTASNVMESIGRTT